MGNFKSLLSQYDAVIFFDTETTGLNADTCQIIELAALRVERGADSVPVMADQMDVFIRLPEGEKLPENIVELTGITDAMLAEGVSEWSAAGSMAQLMRGKVLMCANNAQFDACFLRGLLRGTQIGPVDWLESLTVFKDRRPYPHKLLNAIVAYGLVDKVRNTHRAIDDVLALYEVVKAMDEERDDLASYINIFGFNPKYGIFGEKVSGVYYAPQCFHNSMVPPSMTLPAIIAARTEREGCDEK